VQISMTACSFSAYGWGGGRQAGALCACCGVGLRAGSERTCSTAGRRGHMENRRDEKGGWQAASGVNGLGSNALYFGLYS
jgi:hypothetical protein